jgi:hypothetical protein
MKISIYKLIRVKIKILNIIKKNINLINMKVLKCLHKNFLKKLETIGNIEIVL